ncbi:cadmium-translocating P-type ATPase [Sedimentibacter sp. zth1]|uniref:heavy metal translocating P-type ATPase n=1 Tax=Sedimentibacter sp. zth1 TaxID=2816908 RepID=UPI001A935CA4|nr:cation-translocating P-type ATPase [Sedimentibacter sp. zth1]QSX06121.1 cadmium-translocating P-type ATPase [Sedimentibacter sp. zth1]
MKDIENMVGDSLKNYDKHYMTNKEIRKFKKDILGMLFALMFLVSGIIYSKLFKDQTVVTSFIYILGIIVISVPIFVTAIKGLIDKELKHSMEILVSIAIIVAILDNQYTVAILIPVILTFVHFLEEKSIMGGREAIEGLKKMQSSTAILFTDGKTNNVDAKSLKIDDVIVIMPGMALPIDGEVVNGISSIDEKSLTGEPLAKTVVVGDKVYAGTTNIQGVIRVKVNKQFEDTSFQKIVKLLEDGENIKLPETHIVDKFMKYYIPLAIVVSIIVWIFSQNISRAIAVLVVSCPCGHMLISSAPMIAALSNATKKGILIKNSSFVEYLSKVNYIVFDKTGTITNGDMLANSYYLQTAKTFDELISIAACVAHNSLHPVSKSIVKLCKNINFDKDYTVNEIIGKGVIGTKNNNEIILGNYRWIKSLGYDLTDEYESTGTTNWVIKNKNIIGCIIFKDTPRDEASEAIQELKKLEIKKTCILTGDNNLAAEKIQNAVGADIMYSELLPEEKLSIVKEAKENYIVGVVGDGINDALALSEAHIGIAMGAMGSDTAIQSSDIALMNNNLNNIPFIIKLSRKTKNIIYQNIILSFTTSLIMIFLAGAGIVTPIFGAFLHNIGAFIVLINSSRIINDNDIK